MSIIDTLMSSINPTTLGTIASKLGESPDAVKAGLQSGSATILSGLAGKVNDSGFMGQAMRLISDPANSSVASTAASLASGGGVSDIGSKFLSMLFGSNQSAVTSALGKAAGLSSTSAGSILAMAAPLVMSGLSQKINLEGLNPASLGSFISAEAAGLKRFLPAGLGNLMPSMPSVSMPSASMPAASGSKGWLWMVLLGLLVLGGLLWYFMRGSDVNQAATDVAKTATDTAASAAGSMSDAMKAATAALGEFFKRKLPNGVELNIPQLGVENKLLDFIEDKSKLVDKTTWFDFDRLLFDTGSATLTADSQEQLSNVAAILKAYPNVHIKIGGYTDNTGDKAANVKLSDDRAKNVRGELVKLGVEPARLEAEGYGDQFPVGDNSTEEGRAKNRRISMRVTAK